MNNEDIRKFKLDPGRTALVVVDIQEKLAAAMPPNVAADVIRNTVTLMETAKDFGMPVLVTEQYPKGLGLTVKEIQDALQSYEPIEKITFSCWRTLAFARALEATGAQNVILAGMETHVCLLQTALDLLEKGYRVFIPSDALCSRGKANWRAGLRVMEQAGAVVGSTEMFLFQMLETAGTDRFKRLSKLVR
jgi:nicotinamidase-related amidase